MSKINLNKKYRWNIMGTSFFLCVLTFIFSVGNIDSANAQQGGQDVIKESPDIIGNLDSLVNLWYLKNSAAQRTKNATNVYGFRPGQVPEYNDSVYRQRIYKMAKESGMPFTYNSMVKSFIDLYAVRKRDQVEKMLGLADYYFPIYEETFIKYDIPLEIRYLSVVESALNAEAVSRTNAVGLWQFMYSTGRLYRMNVTNYVDERKDPYKSSVAAALYLKDLYNTFGDWFLALAAYNCGPGNINKAIRRSGGKKTFWEIYNYLPMETRGYVPAFIAASYVFTYHREHNLYPQTINLPSLIDTVYVSRELDFKTLTTTLNVPNEVIRDLNPQFKKYRIPADEEHKFELRLPSAKASLFAQIKDSIYNYQKKLYPEYVAGVKAESTVTTSSDSTKKTTSANTQTQVQQTQYSKVYYTVKAKDKLPEIATLFDVSVYYLMRWNNMKSYNVNAGKKLQIFVSANKASYYQKINIMTTAQKRKILGLPAEENAVASHPVIKKETVTPKQAKKEETTQYYVVQKGDTLWSIAQRFPGVSVDDIKRANNLTENHSIHVGQKIKIQKKAA